MEDDHVDRPGVEVRRRMKLTGTNNPIGLIVSQQNSFGFYNRTGDVISSFLLASRAFALLEASWISSAADGVLESFLSYRLTW